MTKKKKRTVEKKSLDGYQIELIGVAMILISIIGLCQWGPVGSMVKAFAAFLMGNLYGLLLITVIVIGIYLMIKRERPKFFSGKLIGLYLTIISVLVICHLLGGYYKDFEMTTFGEALGNIWNLTNEQLNGFIESSEMFSGDLGGGVIGMFLSLSLVSLVDYQGALVVSIVLAVCGFLIATGISLVDVLKNIGEDMKEKRLARKEAKRAEKDKLAITKAEEDYENDNKVVYKSVDEIIHINNDTGEVIDKAPINNNVPVSNPAEVKKEVQLQAETLIEGTYIYPSINLLNRNKKSNTKENELAIKTNVPILERVLLDFGIEGRVVAAHVGPAVTQYEVEIKAGTKVSKILGLNREIALALAARDVRIQAPIPGKKTIGIELPNKAISSVLLREILETIPNSQRDSKLLVALGKDIMGDPRTFEINKTPHLLVAGSTGSGKSVCINSMITSILMRARPDEVKLVLVDPKKVELSMYNCVPHLLVPVVTDPKKANIVLKKIVSEMERRYDLFEASGTKNIAGYNTYIEKKNEISDEKGIKLPYIVVIIDELADLMLVAAKEVEDSIMRITQMARAAGIHLIVATQRPSTDVITGVVKANIPSRISFAVSSSIDSRTILDMTGAEKLLGKGDMLFLPQGENTPIRIQGTFVSDEEIKAVVDHTIKQQTARYDMAMMMADEEMNATTMCDDMTDGDEEPLYNEIVEFIVREGKASASLLQRRFRLGYNRAARVIDLLEERGIIGPNNGSKPRVVLVKLDENNTENE